MRDIGSAVTSTLDLQDVLERLHTELGRVIDVSNSFVGLYDADQRILSYPIAYDNGTADAIETAAAGRRRQSLGDHTPPTALAWQ